MQKNKVEPSHYIQKLTQNRSKAPPKKNPKNIKLLEEK